MAFFFQALQDSQEILDQRVREVIKDVMEFLVQLEKKEKQVPLAHHFGYTSFLFHRIISVTVILHGSRNSSLTELMIFNVFWVCDNSFCNQSEIDQVE